MVGYAGARHARQRAEMPPNAAPDHHDASLTPAGRAAPVLLAFGGLSLVAAGGLLWSVHGAAVFVETAVLAALAWCF
jgi:hypothetical protein